VVRAHDLKRRHLNESQRATVAAQLATMKQGQRTDLAEISAKSQRDAATMLNVSRGSVQHAAREKAEPELQAAVEQGHIAVKATALPAAARLRSRSSTPRRESFALPKV
jgi:DNA-binding XRE family transcriptional regulator